MITKEAQGLPQEKLSDDDHKRGCEGRQYSCTCGYDDRRDALIRSLSEANAALEEKLKRCERMHLPKATTAALLGHQRCMEAFNETQLRALTAEAALSAATAESERLKGVMADEVTAAQTKSLDVSLDGNTRRGYALAATRLGAVLSVLSSGLAVSKAEAAERGNDLEGGDDA